MKRQGLSIGFAFVIWPAITAVVAAQTLPVNPLRRRAEPRPVAETTVDQEVAPPVPKPHQAQAIPAEPVPVGPTAVEPKPIQASDAQPMRSIPRATPKAHTARTRSSRSPFQLIQFGVRVPQQHNRSRFASRLTQPATPAPGPVGPGSEEVIGAPELMTPGTIFEDETVVGGPDCCGGVGCDQCGVPGVQCPSLRNFEFFAGTQGFTNETNRGGTGSFGFNYGFNWGAPLYCLTNGEIGMQAGFRGVTSNLDGAEYSAETRNQYFITAGLFRRVDYGLQGGVVFDYLGESWYYNGDMKQIRGEISWMFPACHEIGFWFAARGNESTVTSTILTDNAPQQLNERLAPVTQYRFFYRRRFEDCGAEGRFSAGWTSNGDGIIGADFQLPISDRWALESTFTYLIPEGDASTGAYQQEAWNVAIGLVWYPGIRDARSNDYFRPLFDVADNGSFILSR